MQNNETNEEFQQMEWQQMRLLDEFLNMSTQGLAGSREKSQSLWDHMVGNISLLVFACLESGI